MSQSVVCRDPSPVQMGLEANCCLGGIIILV